MKATKWMAKTPASLLIIAGIAMVVTAAVRRVWTAHRAVTVTPAVTVVSDPEIADISLMQGTSKAYDITVTNSGTTIANVTLACTVSGGTGVTATIAGASATQTIAAEGTFVYHVTVAALPTAAGSATVAYELTQS